MTTATKTKPRRYDFRSWEKMPGEDLVPIHRTLALDLVKLLDVSCFWEGQEEEDGEHDPEKCQALFEAHRERMERMAQTLSMHLSAEEPPVTPDLMLRAVVMSYEAAQHYPGTPRPS